MEPAIEFVVPPVPSALRANNRSHWRTKNRAADDYSRVVFAWFNMNCPTGGYYTETCPWKHAHITYTWRYCGPMPDVTNVAASVKVLQDCLQMAPRNGGANRYYLGIVEDDKHVTADYKLEKVARRAAEGVVVTITKREDT